MREIQPSDFRYTLTCLGRDWVLPQAPKGWEQSDLNWKRSPDYYGMIRTYTNPYEFTLDGAWLLRRVYYTQGVNGQCSIKIEILNRSTWQYENLYLGEIDFSTFKDEGVYVTANVMEGGPSAAVAAYDSVKYEIPISPDSMTVRIPGIDKVEEGSAFPWYDNVNSIGYFPGLQIDLNELFAGNVVIQDQQFSSPSTLTPSPTNWFIEGQNPTTETRIYGSIEYWGITPPNYYYQFQIVDISGNPVAILGSTQGGSAMNGNPNDVRTFNFDTSINIISGQRLFVLVRRYGSGSAPVLPFFAINGGKINVSYGITTEPSLVQAVKPLTLFNKILQRMGANAPAQSNTLQIWDNLLITSGDAIRGLEGAVIKTTFKDFFKSIDAVLCCGFGIENGIARIEQKQYWYRAIQVLNLGEIKDVIIQPAEEYIFNSIKAGYPDDDYEVDRGREEYNSEQIWSTAIQRIQKQLDISSVYRADQYGIEQVRLTQDEDNRDNAREKDKKQDNDVFFIHAKKTPGEDGIYDVIGAENYTNITGISTRSSSYNLEITPKKNLLRHGMILRSFLPESSVIEFASATKNAELSTTDLNGRTVKENENIGVSTLDTPLYRPIKITFKTKLPPRIQNIMETNSSGYIQFLYRGHPFYGYILEASQDVARNSEREFSLLLTKDSDPTKLIE